MFDFFHQTFSNHLFLMDSSFLPCYIYYKWFNTWNFFCIRFSFFIIQCNSWCVLKTFIVYIFLTYCFFFFFIQIGESIYKPALLKFALWHFWYYSWTESNIKSFPFTGFLLIFLIYWAKWLKEFINNIICITIRCKSYTATIWMHHTLFFYIFWWNKVNCKFNRAIYCKIKLSLFFVKKVSWYL